MDRAFWSSPYRPGFARGFREHYALVRPGIENRAQLQAEADAKSLRETPLAACVASPTESLLANPGAQRTVFDSVLNASRATDTKYGTQITRDVWKNVVQGNFTTYP
jgi:hypothetical protein